MYAMIKTTKIVSENLFGIVKNYKLDFNIFEL